MRRHRLGRHFCRFHMARLSVCEKWRRSAPPMHNRAWALFHHPFPLPEVVVIPLSGTQFQLADILARRPRRIAARE